MTQDSTSTILDAERQAGSRSKIHAVSDHGDNNSNPIGWLILGFLLAAIAAFSWIAVQMIARPFAIAFITVTAFTGWHMSDAFARAQADIEKIAAGTEAPHDH